MSFIDLDKPRRLRFGFSAFGHLKDVYGITEIEPFFKGLEKGDLTVIPKLVDACLSCDYDGLSKEKVNILLDEYLEKNGLDGITKVINEVITESAIFKEAKKKMEVQRQKKK